MEDVTSAYFSGLWHGALGVGFIIFGIIGWPATRFVLSVLFFPFSHRKPQTPVGSTYFDKYSAPQRKPQIDFQAISIDENRK